MNLFSSFKQIGKGVLIAFFITLILYLIFALVLAYTNISDDLIPTYVFVIYLVSIFVSTSFIAINARENGLKIGGLIGFLYIIVPYILSSVHTTGFGVDNYAISTIIFSILIGMIGGIVGVNLVK